MLCISRSGNLYVPIRGGKPEYHPATGVLIQVKRPLAAQFRRAGDIPAHAKEAVSKMPDWGRGIGIEEDPFTLCGIFDLELAAAENDWDEEEVEAVAAGLRRADGQSFVIVDKPKLKAPWPAYDKVSPNNEDEAAFTISKKVVEDGYSPYEVKAYEADNANRAKVIEALDLLIADQEKDVLGVIPA